MRLGLHLIAICLLAADFAARISEPPLLAAPSSEQSSSSQAAATTPAVGYVGSDTCMALPRRQEDTLKGTPHCAGEESALAGGDARAARAATVPGRRTSTTTQGAHPEVRGR